MKIFDSHCHPQFPQYDADRDEMIKRNLDQGVFMIAVGADLETSKQAIELANKYENIWATVGQHPTDVESGSMNQESWAELLKQPKVVAVGEVGLDYYRTPELEKQEQQRGVFKEFLDLAIQYDKPVVIHTRDSAKGSNGKVFKDLFEILSTKGGPASGGNMSLRGVIHSCTASVEEAAQFIDLGFYLGFNGIITFARQYDELVKYVPLDRILLETDAPYLPPDPYRGQRNEPVYVVEVAKKLAELKNEPLERVIEQTTKNRKQLFGI